VRGLAVALTCTMCVEPDLAAAARARLRPPVVVMGVSGCGKTTLAQALAQDLGLDMLDGDDLHLPQSVAKMRSGQPLEDADRWPWLDRVGRSLSDLATGCSRVIACSALKRIYRDRLRDLAPGVRFVFLDGDERVIRQRMDRRAGHYMPPGLLASQLQTLERPQADEVDVLTLDLALTVVQLVERVRLALAFDPANAPTSCSSEIVLPTD
jgi:carbohydrate kinase (thermoresistant glucokinase family)